MNPRKAPAVCHPPPPPPGPILPPPFNTPCRVFCDWYKHMGFPTTPHGPTPVLEQVGFAHAIGASIVEYQELFTIPHDYAENWFGQYPPAPIRPRVVIQVNYNTTTNRYRLQAWLMYVGYLPFEYADFTDQTPYNSNPFDSGWLYRGGPKPASSVSLRVQQTPH